MAFVESSKHKQRPLQSSIPRLEQFWLYEARSNFYIVGFDAGQTFFRLLKINRENPNPRDLAEIVREDPLSYNAEEITDILDMINEGNKTQGGLVKLCTACGIVGFVKFLNGFYLTMITQKKEVGCIGGNYIYSIKATEMFPIRPKDETSSNTLRYLWKQFNKRITQTSSEMAENRYLGLFQFIDMTKDFFFSYSYDLTHSMQHNYITTNDGRISQSQDIFEWNHHQVHGLRGILGEGSAFMWITPIIHGSFQQKRFTFFGKIMDLILIARRSRYYAGTRYLKRGINVHGKVANDVEVEQILQFENGADFKFTSYVQMRGSIPAFWAQETSLTMPKPPITLSRTDPDYLATQEHFADLMRRYSSPIIVLDLVKQHEKRPRESLVGREFRQAIEIINESIPTSYQVRYIALDYSKITSISKGKLSKAKPVKKGFMGIRSPAEKERAMAAVGQEWAMMEKSLTKTNQGKGSSKESGNNSKGLLSHADKATTTPKRTTFVASGRSASPPPTPAVASGFASLDEARKAIDAEHTSGYQFTQDHSSHHAPVLPGGLDNIAEINALESRIDVLKELEDIATLTLSETAFFCNTTQFSDRLVDVIPPRTMELAKRTGLIVQSGVLRTNCIDCLDRTNGGQFAVAMRFLAFAFRALGVSEDHSLDISKDPVLLSLMEMYGEMGDKIALQYGGSEAHKKVIAGKSVQSSSSSKQSELLTSIKRYYSNAFTDMMKQDAMNLFLGCFNPFESSVPLWDMESDQSLHNLALHPPFPKSYAVMFDEIIRDSEVLRHSSLRSKLEQRLKKVIMYGLDVEAQSATGSMKKSLPSSSSLTQLATDNDGKDDKDHQGQTGENLSRVSSGVFTPIPPSPIVLDTNSGNPESNALVTKNTFDFLTQQYFIRPLQHSDQALGLPASSRNSSRHQSSRGLVSSITRQLARLERRRLMRITAYRKVTKANQNWWQSALRDHVHALLLADCGEAKEMFRTMPTSTTNSLSYYERFHQPRQLTEFDTLFAQEFSNPIVGAEAALVSSSAAAAAGMSGRVRSIALHDDDDGIFDPESGDGVDGEGRKRTESDDQQQQPAINSLMTFFFAPPSPITVPKDKSDGGRNSRQNSIQDGPGPLALSRTTSFTNPTASAPSSQSYHQHPLGSNALDLSSSSLTDDSNPQRYGARPVSASNATNNAFGLTKYVREFGQKARNIFLRKEDGDEDRSGGNRRHSHDMTGLLRAAHDFNRRNAPITSLLHYIPQVSAVIYNQYAEIYDNPLLLLNPDPDEHQNLLREITIEGLAKEYSDELKKKAPSARGHATSSSSATTSSSSSSSRNSKRDSSKPTTTGADSKANNHHTPGTTKPKSKKSVTIKKASKKAAAEKLLEDEYNFLLRDNIIPLDDVRRMEQLASDGYISSDIQKGLFAGMSQMSSANLAVSLLFISLVNMEKELQAFGEHVEQQAEKSRARSLAMEVSSRRGGGKHDGGALLLDDDDDVGGLGDTAYLGDDAGKGKGSGGVGGKKHSVRSAFATSALPFLGLGGGFAGLSSSSSPVNTGANGGGVGGGGAGGDAYLARKSSKTTSLEMTTALNDRIGQCLQRMRVANGLETEFRKYVNNYVFQQYNYLKEISFERLSRRISTLSSEKSIVQYVTQFEPDFVASGWDQVIYMAKEGPNYVSFRELRAFQTSEMEPRQAMLRRLAKEYADKQAQIAKQQQSRQQQQQQQQHGEESPLFHSLAAGATSSAAALTTVMTSARRRSEQQLQRRLKKCRRGNASIASLMFPAKEPAAPGAITSTTTTTTTLAPASASASVPVPGQSSQPHRAQDTMSAQLGILNADVLWTDLQQDFVLPAMISPDSIREYESFPFYDTSTVMMMTSSGGSGSSRTTTTMLPYEWNASDAGQNTTRPVVAHAYLAAYQDFSAVSIHHFVQPDIIGFHQLAPDLYSRRTNPHLQMNEVCATRFKDVLLTDRGVTTTATTTTTAVVN